MWLDSPLMQPGAVTGPQQDPNDLQYWLSWDLITDGPAFSADPSSLDGTMSNPSSLEGSLDSSVNTSPSTLFADVMDSPKFDFSNLNRNANSLFPRSSACDDDGLFDYGQFYRDRSTHLPTPPRGNVAPVAPMQRTSISPLELQAQPRQFPTPRQEPPTVPEQQMTRTSSQSTQSECDDSEYAESRRSSCSASPPPRQRTSKKKRPSVDTTDSASKRSKRPGSVVDKKYRDKLKDKMAELKRTVPTVRAALDGEGGENGDGVAGLMPASNSRKPTILTKAIEYIHYLEDRNESLNKQLAHVRPQVVG